MDSIAQCGNQLRTNDAGTQLCTDCPGGTQPPQFCCLSSEVDAQRLGTPRNDCGLRQRGLSGQEPPPVLGVRRYCLMEATTEAEWDLPDGLTGFSLSRGNARMTLVRPTTFQTEPGVCTVGGRALMRLQWYNLFGNPNIPIVESRADFEFCDAVTIACPPIGQGEWLVDAVGRVPTYVIDPLVRYPFVRDSRPINAFAPGVNTPAYVSVPRWQCDGDEYIYTLTEERYDPDFGPPGGPFVRRLLARLTFRARFRVDHLETCQGQPSTHAGNCAGESGPCIPGPEAYFISEPCDPNYAGPPVLFPVENVSVCAVVPTSYGCMKVSPQSATTANPTAIGGVIDIRLVNSAARLPLTCCDCVPGCPSQPVSVPTCWTTNGARNDVTGWVTAPAPVESGSCCCSPADLITVAELSSVWELPHLDWRIVNSLRTGPVTTGRGVEWELPILVRSTYLSSGSQLFPDEDITYPMGPWLCGSGPFDGIPHSSFPYGPQNLSNPHTFPGLHATAYNASIPLMLCPATMTSVDGTMPGGARWESFQIAATCTLIVFTSRYTWVDDPAHPRPRSSSVTQRLVLRLTPGPAADRRCVGGCGQPRIGVPVDPGNPTNPTPNPGNGGMIRVSGGCGSCAGQSGGLG